ALVLNITLTPVRVTAQRRGEPPNAGTNQIRSSQPTKQVEPGRGIQPATGPNQSSAVPPITITVTNPEKSAEEKNAERQQAERQNATNERIAKFTFWLVIVGAGQVLLGIF